MKAYIAQDKKDAVVVLRTMRRSELDSYVTDQEFTQLFNGFVSSNNLQELLLAIAPLPPIIPPLNRENCGDKRVFKPSEIKSALDVEYRPCDAKSVEYQSHFDAGIPEERESRTRATNSAIRGHGAHSEEFAEELRLKNSDEYCVVCEPLSDWVFARNVLGLTARLLAHLSLSSSDDVLTEAGMSFRYNNRLGEELYSIPFLFNPYFFATKFNRESLMARTNYDLYRPLMALALGSPRRVRKGVRDSWLFDFDKDAKDVYIATDPVATEQPGPLFSRKQDDIERRYRLCIERKGRSQRELAEHVIASMVNTVSNLRDGATLFGWELDEESYYDESEFPRFIAHSAFSQLMYMLIYRSHSTVTLCKMCGNAILSADAGKPREYCSEACRQKHLRQCAKARRSTD